MKTTYSIVLANDHKMFLDGITSIMLHESNYKIVFSTSNGLEVKKFLKANLNESIDLVILDVNMPKVDGVTLNKFIKQNTSTKTLVVSMLSEPRKIMELIEGGVDGYISKNASKCELLKAVNKILKGEKYFSKDVKERYAEGVFYKKEKSMSLTQREKQILQLIGEEYTTQEIANELFLSKYTVEGYRSSLFSKLNVRNVVGLAKHALRMGLVK